MNNMTQDMTTMKIQNIKSHLLRSLLVVVMMVWGVGEAAGQTNYVFYNATYGFLYNNNGSLGVTKDFDPFAVWVASGDIVTGNGNLRSVKSYISDLYIGYEYSNNDYHLTFTSNSSSRVKLIGNYLGIRSEDLSLGFIKLAQKDLYVRYSNGVLVLSEDNNGERFIPYVVKITQASELPNLIASSQNNTLTPSGDNKSTTLSARVDGNYNPLYFTFNNGQQYWWYNGKNFGYYQPIIYSGDGCTTKWEITGSGKDYVSFDSDTKVLTYNGNSPTTTKVVATATVTHPDYLETDFKLEKSLEITLRSKSYNVELSESSDGHNLRVDKTSASQGDAVTMYVDYVASGFTFTSWTVTDSDGNAVSVTMKDDNKTGTFTMPASDVTVIANFTPNEYNITTTSNINGGSLSNVPTKARYKDEVSLASVTITPDEGFAFDHWVVTDANNSPITVNDNKFVMPHYNVNVSAVFTDEVFHITTKTAIKDGETITESAACGSVTGGGDFRGGSKTTLTARANEGYTFSKWDDGVTTNPRVIENIQADATYTAYFTAKKYKVQKVAAASGGDFTISGMEQEGDNDVAGTGTVLTLTATPDSGYDLGSWKIMDANDADITETVGLHQTGNTATFNMPAKDIKVTATFTLKEYDIIINNVAGGTITASASKATMGQEITLNVVPAEGYNFVSWDVKGPNDTPIIVTDNKFTMPAGNVTVTATYEAATYIVTIAECTGGDVTANPTSGHAGDVISLSVTADEGMFLASLTAVDEAGNDVRIKNYKFTLPASDVTVTALFLEVTADCSEDHTRGVDVSSWKRSDNNNTIDNSAYPQDWAANQVTTNDGRTCRLAEVYYSDTNGSGERIYQSLTGLPNGRYKVVLYANSCYTLGGTSPVTEDQMDVAYIFANNEKEYIPCHVDNNVKPASNEATVYATVTDGTLRIGIGTSKVGTNWHTVQIKYLAREITCIASLSEITDENGSYALIMDNPLGVPAVSNFSGTLDGNFHIISGLQQPLFTSVTNATIKNVILDNVSISGAKTVNNVTCLGAIACYATGNTKIYNCGVQASGSTYDENGNLVTNSSTISGGQHTGSLVGYIPSGANVRVVNNYSYANVSCSTYSGGIVGRNVATALTKDNITDTSHSAITHNMFYGNLTNGTNNISPVYSGNHTSNIQNVNEYNYWRNRADVTYNKYNNQLAIDKDEYLNRFPFYRHILNTHRELAAIYLFGSASDENVAEIGHWYNEKTYSDETKSRPYPIIEPWATNTKKTTEDIKNNLPITNDDYAGKLLTEMGSSGYLRVNWSVYGKSGFVDLPITDMDSLNYDFTWGKVVLPFANELAERNTYEQVCTGWKIMNVDGTTSGTITNYNFADRDNKAKDLYSVSGGYVFAQGGNYIVPYGVKEITIEANMATAFYLRDASYDIGYNNTYAGATAVGGTITGQYHGQNVYTSLSELINAMDTKDNPHEQAIVLVGNYHYNQNVVGTCFNTGKGLTIMSVDEDNNQEPDYGWYSYHTTPRTGIPSLRFDFVPNIGIGMAARTTGSTPYPTIGIWHSYGWFELTETCVSIMSECEINDRLFTTTGLKNRWIVNSGYFIQIVRCRDAACSKLSYLQIGGNAYVEQLYPGPHMAQSSTIALCPIVVTGGEIEECFMTGKGALNNGNPPTATGDNIYFWCAGGRIHKYLSAYMVKPSATSVNVTAKIDHARIYRFFGGGTSSMARITGDINVTINNSLVDFYCGGPEFGNMNNGKTVKTVANGTTFKEYYGAGYGGTSTTWVQRTDDQPSFSADKEFPSDFTTNYVNYRLVHDSNRGFGSCYDFEFIMYSGGTGSGVGRFYTGYSDFSLAQTGSITNELTNCTIGYYDKVGNLHGGNFYGGGCQGTVSGNATSTLKDCTVYGSAFGGGYKAPETIAKVYPTTKPTYSKYIKETGIFSDFGTVEPEDFKWVQGTAGQKDEANKILYTDVDFSSLGVVTGYTDITIDGGSVGGSVFGGGNESQAKNNAKVTIKGDATVDNNVFGGGNLANVAGATEVNINGGTLNTVANTAVYGGGALANVGGDTQVNLNGGSVGSVYGGGLGRLASETETAIAATVGSATINIGSGTPDNSVTGGAKDVAGSCQITGSVFGCNNLNGTPTGNATVNVFKTYNATPDEPNSYNSKIEAVYGGGNLAAYLPTANTSTAKVTVYTCYNAIDYVYGGGNAASTPATNVTIWGGKMINVFGGGNGAGEGNPGADVGYKDFTWDDSHAYGAGTTTVNIWGGVIENVFGGSNTRGNIRVSSNVNLDDKEGCEFQIGGVYGAGNEAAMYGNGNLVIGCIPGMTEIYGGAKAADINGDVSLTITNGTFGKVFGGNNLGGKLNGSITVNIEETGCKPVIIGELYGCGNQAPYSVYGYEEALDANGKVVVKESGDKLHNDPVVNIYSCTSIGSVFGGGYGAGAVVVGSPTVNINQVKGTPNNVESSTLGTIETIFGGGNAARVIGDTNVNIGTLKKYTVLSGTAVGTEKTIVGANITGNVFGGGNEAEVTGKTNVVIGADK